MAPQPQEHVPVPKLTIRTVDQAIHDWFDVTVDSQVETPTGERKKVPIALSSGERWVSSREKKAIRDKNGIIILPVISIRRTGITASPTMNALGVETPNIQISKRVDPKTNLAQNASALRPPSQRLAHPVVYEVTTIPFPDFSVFSYDIQVQTQYIGQMNTVLEKLFHELDIQKSFVMPTDGSRKHSLTGVPFEDRKPFKGGYIVGFFDPGVSSQDNFEEFTDQERIVRWSATVTVPVPLVLDPEGERPSVKVERTAFDLRIGDEDVKFVDDPYEIELIFSSPDPISAYKEIVRRRGQR